MDSRLWPCTPCGEVVVFVQPPCGDGHTDDGGECPEWVCAECGTAVLSDVGDVGPARPLVRAA